MPELTTLFVFWLQPAFFPSVRHIEMEEHHEEKALDNVPCDYVLSRVLLSGNVLVGIRHEYQDL